MDYPSVSAVINARRATSPDKGRQGAVPHRSVLRLAWILITVGFFRAIHDRLYGCSIAGALVGRGVPDAPWGTLHKARLSYASRGRGLRPNPIFASEQTPYRSPPRKLTVSLAPLLLLSQTQPLRWVVFGCPYAPKRKRVLDAQKKKSLSIPVSACRCYPAHRKGKAASLLRCASLSRLPCTAGLLRIAFGERLTAVVTCELSSDR